MKIRLTIEAEVEQWIFDETVPESKEWFEQQVLSASIDNKVVNLILHSNELGDTVGFVTKVENLEYLLDTTDNKDLLTP